MDKRIEDWIKSVSVGFLFMILSYILSGDAGASVVTGLLVIYLEKRFARP